MGHKVIDLFAGCGGLTAGFYRRGFEPVFAVELDRAAAATYAVNFGGDHIHVGDITRLPSDELPSGADVVVGGPPCQGFSQLGTRDPDDPRNLLWKEYARVVAAVRPHVFVLENVPQFLKSAQFELMQEFTRGGDLGEYEIVADVLNAADYGVPQRRRRAIVIGSRIGTPSLPTPTHGPGTGQEWRGVVDAIGNTPAEAGPSDLPERKLDDGTPGWFKAEELHLSRNPREISLRRYASIPPGGNRFDLPEDLQPACWRNKATGTTDVMGRLEWDRPALTIRTEFFKPEKGRYLHPDADRPITHREAAALQGFDSDFKWCGTKIEIARQIGNAVPVGLAQAIAGSAKELLAAVPAIQGGASVR